MKNTAKKSRVNFRTTPEAKKLLGIISRHLGISQTAVFELMVREKSAKLFTRDDNSEEYVLSGNR